MIINTKTKLFGLLGYPLIQSLSPIMQNAAFEEYKLNKIYIPIEVSAENLEAVIKGISKMNFGGFNITKPYKIKIMEYLDEIDEYAKLIGAVNTVTIKDGKLKGYNTDGTGFLKSFEENFSTEIQDKNVFILGSGGAARAIGMIVALNGAKKIYLCNRTLEKAKILSSEINKSTVNCSVAVPMSYNEMKVAIDDSHVLINCTSVGMLPDIGETPIDKRLLHKDLIVCDSIYNPEKTQLMLAAESIGCRAANGAGMLIYQGAEAFELWTNKKAPVHTMAEAVNRQLHYGN